MVSLATVTSAVVLAVPSLSVKRSVASPAGVLLPYVMCRATSLTSAVVAAVSLLVKLMVSTPPVLV